MVLKIDHGVQQVGYAHCDMVVLMLRVDMLLLNRLEMNRCDLPKVQSSKYELLWIKVGLCVNESGSSPKRGAILERAAKWARGL